MSTQSRLAPIVFVGQSSSAVAGSFTVSRIFLRTNSAAASFTRRSSIMSAKAPMKSSPPSRQRRSNSASTSSGVFSVPFPWGARPAMLLKDSAWATRSSG